VITGATAGNPHTKVFNAKAILASKDIPNNSSPILLVDFFPYGLNFNVGSFVAVGDYNRDGFADVITGASVGNPQVRVFSGGDATKGTFSLAGSLLDEYYAFDVGQNIGIAVAAADFTGDGKVDVLTGTRSGIPRRRVYKNNSPNPATILTGYDVPEGSFSGGIYVAV
jgi:hypothetical protein